MAPAPHSTPAQLEPNPLEIVIQIQPDPGPIQRSECACGAHEEDGA